MTAIDVLFTGWLRTGGDIRPDREFRPEELELFIDQQIAVITSVDDGDAADAKVGALVAFLGDVLPDTSELCPCEIKEAESGAAAALVKALVEGN